MMTFKSTLEKVRESKVFKDFIKENKDAELCAGFFIIDYFSHDNKTSLDYKTDDSIYTFDLKDNGEIKMQKDNLIKDSPLHTINSHINIDLDELKNIIETEKNKLNIKAKLNKVIAILQIYENKQVWNLTCMLEGLIMIHAIINSETKEIIKFERKSMSDFIRKA